MPQYSLVGFSSHGNNSDVEIHLTFQASSENDVWRYIVTHWGDDEIEAQIPERYTLDLYAHNLTVESLKTHIERNNDQSYTLKLVCGPTPINVIKSKIETPSEATAKMIKKELDTLAKERAEYARVDARLIIGPRYHHRRQIVPDLQETDSEWLRNNKIRRVLRHYDYFAVYEAPNTVVIYFRAADGVYDLAYINKLINAGEPRVVTKM